MTRANYTQTKAIRAAEEVTKEAYCPGCAAYKRDVLRIQIGNRKLPRCGKCREKRNG